MYSFCVLSVIRDTFYVVVFYYMFMCVSCFGLVVGTVGCRKTPLMTPLCGVEITCTKPTLKRLFMCIFIHAEHVVHSFYPRRARSALGVDTVLTLDVCMFVCMYVCMYVC